jgi:hypothetical protein
MATNCQSVKDRLLHFLGDGMRISQIRDYCVLTMPQKTVDARLASVFVQEKMPNYYLVHDGGKTSAELFAQGIHLTELMTDALQELASRYGATFVQGTFRVGCKAEELSSSIMAITQCATLGTWYVLGHKPQFEDEPVMHRVKRGLETWRAPYPVDIRERVHIFGRKSEHVLHFVAAPRHVNRNPICINVVRPSDSPLSQARGYGYMAYDLQETQYAAWPRLAVMMRADEWTEEALDTMHKSATNIVPIETGKEEEIPERLHQYMSEVAA